MRSSPRTLLATPSQEGLWLLHHSIAGRYLYNCPFAFRVRGPLDCVALTTALGMLVQRHDSLRTVFVSKPEGLMQVVHTELPPDTRSIDLSAMPPQAAQRELARLAEATSLDAFDLERGSLVRLTIAKMTPDDYVLMFTVHHAVFDEWSTDILIRELGVLYRIAASGGDGAEIAPPRMQFPDYAAWQGRPEAAPEMERQLSHWRRCLMDAVAPVMVPADHRPNPGHDDYRGERECFTLDSSARRALDALAGRVHAPPAAILVATLALVLNRYTRERDISLGYIVSGRLLPESESMIGMLVNSLVLRIQFAEQSSFEDVVQQVRDLLFDAYSNQDVPFQKIVRELNPARDVDGHPLFRCCVNYHVAAREVLALDGLQCEPFVAGPEIAQFELLLDACPSADGRIECRFEYRTNLFERATMQRFARHFSTLLNACLAAPSEPVSSIAFIDERERDLLLYRWNATGRDYDTNAGIADLLAAIARDMPDKAALVAGDGHMSYSQFDRVTDGVAAYLQKQGIGPEMRVGLCADASIDMIVGMFGILKAGAAYVALDPEHPPSRLAYLLDSARLSFVLAQERFIGKFANSGLRSAALDRDAALFEAAGKPESVRGRRAEQLAYLMYTSGSTGKPKAVAISWGSVLNHVCSFREASGLRADDRCMLFSSFAFDGSVEEIFAPLLTGATLAIHPERPIPIETLEQLIVQHRLTFLDFTAGYWNVWLELLVARGKSIPEPVRQVVIGGEMIRANQLISWDRVDRGGEVGLLITYGPTEATVIAAGIRYQGAKAGERTVHRDGYLGRPLGNLSIYVLDDDLQPVPPGAIGELYIGGANLARGYFDAPALTAERFIPNPYATEPGQRIYRTGDLALRLPDGTLLHKGRADNQIKFRGFRIELGEIERCLAQFPHAQAAAAAIATAPNGDPTLVVFVMPAGSYKLDVDAVRQFLAVKLPSYLVPQRIEITRTFPVKASGKTDVAKLVEALEWSKDGASAARMQKDESETPGEGMAVEIAGIFTALLKRGTIAPRDNFFKAGGHSLLALQVLSRIRQAHGVQVSIKDFYLQPTAEGLAGVVERLKQSNAANGRSNSTSIARSSRT
ncbi:hypothetical protein WS67_03810 [Burkholderia singularis]|uniref:Carrier domain-containing protein n=1 Tax=Burkholderia singularis TaxID=1503053 RepID=A0A103E7T8_9BURK|nr:non-ribosomal peptide synthetase [Burkholderia singularis]KVE30002.1 hypothetical protein WS67_03810 [Burkholderia singularis]